MMDKHNCKRLQSSDWHSNKHHLTLIALTCSNKGNLCGKYVDDKGHTYIHWLNDIEKASVLAAAVGKLELK